MTTLQVVRSVAAICLVFTIGLLVGTCLPTTYEQQASSSCCSSSCCKKDATACNCCHQWEPCSCCQGCCCAGAAAEQPKTLACVGDPAAGWKKGPLPKDTYNWGGIVTDDIKNTRGFWMADFRGDHVRAYKGKGIDDWVRVEPKDVLWYNNSLTLPPPAAAKGK